MPQQLNRRLSQWSGSGVLEAGQGSVATDTKSCISEAEVQATVRRGGDMGRVVVLGLCRGSTRVEEVLRGCAALQE